MTSDSKAARGGRREGAGRNPLEIDPWKLEAAMRHRASGWKWEAVSRKLDVPVRTLKRRLSGMQQRGSPEPGKIKPSDPLSELAIPLADDAHPVQTAQEDRPQIDYAGSFLRTRQRRCNKAGKCQMWPEGRECCGQFQSS